MPGMSGIETAAILKRIMPQTPIILFTLHEECINRELAARMGVDMVVDKTGGIPKLGESVKPYSPVCTLLTPIFRRNHRPAVIPATLRLSLIKSIHPASLFVLRNTRPNLCSPAPMRVVAIRFETRRSEFPAPAGPRRTLLVMFSVNRPTSVYRFGLCTLQPLGGRLHETQRTRPSIP
jgi:CheY-like chemotaxis protein